LIASIPFAFQTSTFVGVVSFGIFKLTSENSQSAEHTEVRRKNFRGFDMTIHHVPRVTNETDKRMFSPGVAQSVDVLSEVHDTSMFLKIVPPEVLPDYDGITVPCSIPIIHQRSTSDPMHPFAHTALDR
jgi:hypothetical protein